MKAFTKLLPFLVLVSLLSACTNQKPVSEHETLHNQIDSIMTAVPDFSGVVLVASKGKPLYHKAFGYRNFETKVPLDTTDVFELASVSKQFTAMIIMMLKEEGKLNYNDPIEKYLPGLPYSNITIRHLLTHTSGLPDYQAIMDQYWDKSKVAGNEDILIYLKKYQPPALFLPGKKYEYSNTGYVLLGSIAERTSGKDFIELCRQQIFGPLKMKSTDIRSLDEKRAIENFALGHIFVEEKQRYIRADSFPSSNYTIWLGNRKGPGRISSISTDLLLWDRALYKGELVSTQILEEAFTPMKLTNDSLSYYGFGWMLRNDARAVLHTGDNPGYKTKIVRFTDQDKTLIMLCNNAHAKFATVAKALETLLND
ncbi:MAG: serine hydrolase domain-containing protein [Cyclobacteriaceae bacterium]